MRFSLYVFSSILMLHADNLLAAPFLSLYTPLIYYVRDYIRIVHNGALTGLLQVTYYCITIRVKQLVLNIMVIDITTERIYIS